MNKILNDQLKNEIKMARKWYGCISLNYYCHRILVFIFLNCPFNILLIFKILKQGTHLACEFHWSFHYLREYQLIGSFFPISWWIYWNSLTIFEKWNGPAMRWHLKSKIDALMYFEKLWELSKSGKRFARSFWELKWNSKARWVPYLRI